MEYEDFRIKEFRNQTYKCFRNGTIYKLMKGSGEWKQVNNRPHDKHNGKYYYEISTTVNGKRTQVKLHRLLAMVFLGLDIDDMTKVVDHIDGDGLNNDITNLRVCTQRENMRNCKNVKGVSYDKERNRFKTSVTNNEGRQLYFTNKDHDTVLRWRQAKEIELGYMTRSIGIRA